MGVVDRLMKKHARAARLSRVCPALALIALLGPARNEAAAQDVALQLDPQHSTVNFTLGDVLHTVRGTFQLQRGWLRLNSSSGKLEGEIVVNAKTGESGNATRDRKMHHEVLESDRYPEIVFRPDRVEGSVAPQGKSSVQVHGIFSIHGSDHELTAPAEVEMSPTAWTAAIHFALPYVKWGMKNPSTLFLRVDESVDIVVTASGGYAVAK
jgi:polyisoprenoid-binding protein YceI